MSKLITCCKQSAQDGTPAVKNNRPGFRIGRFLLLLVCSFAYGLTDDVMDARVAVFACT